MNIEPFIAALNGGEDYELLFTVPVNLHDQVASLKDVSMIGHITEPSKGTFFVTDQGTEMELQAQGWDGLD
jgi:thiamine-monophosphate kinase